MYVEQHRIRPARRGCWLAVLLGLAVIVGLAIPMVRGSLWLRRERASVDRLAEEALRLGGDAGVPPGGIDISERSIDVHLNLAHANVGDVEFARLASMAAFRRVCSLDLSDTRITDQSLELLVKSGSPILLDVSRTKISDQGVVWIAKLPWLSTLRLSETAVTDRGIEALVKRAGAWDLRSIELDGTPVTEEGLMSLKNVYVFIYVKK